jgi:hypothetical protein
MDTTTAGALGRLTMHPQVSNTVAGDMATKWRRFAMVTIIQPVEVATHLRKLTDPHLHPTRCRLFPRSRVLEAPRSRVLMVRRSRGLMARDHVEVRLDKDIECLSGKRLNHLKLLGFKIGGQIRLPATV